MPRSLCKPLRGPPGHPPHISPSPVAWGRMFERLRRVRGVSSGQGARNDLTSELDSEVASLASEQGARNDLTSATDAEVNNLAVEQGVPERTARNRLKLARELADYPRLEAVQPAQPSTSTSIFYQGHPHGKIGAVKKPIPMGET